MAENTNLPSTIVGASGLGGPQWLVPQSFQDVERLAAKMALAEWVPYSYKNKRTGEVDRNKVELAIMHGATIGIPAIMAPQVIAVIGNTPTVWGDGMLALVLSNPLCEDIKEYYEGQGDELTAFCIVKRRGLPSPAEGKFSVAMAKKAGLWGKEGPWQSNPARMLKMRARAFGIRDRFADILKGLRMAEEVLDEIIDVTPVRSSEASGERPKREDYMPHVDAEFESQPETVETKDAEPAKPETVTKTTEKPAARKHQEPQGGPTAEEAAKQQAAAQTATDAFVAQQEQQSEGETGKPDEPAPWQIVDFESLELLYDDPADFANDYPKELHRALNHGGLDGLRGFIESNAAEVAAYSEKIDAKVGAALVAEGANLLKLKSGRQSGLDLDAPLKG